MDTHSESGQELALAAKVARHVELRDVGLVHLDATLHTPLEQALKALPWEAGIEKATTFRFDAATNVLHVEAELDLKVRPGKGGKKTRDPLVSVRCTLGLDYLFRAKGAPEGEELQRHFESFSTLNGTYNAWPYFREIVQSTIARMGLPPLTLPVYRVAAASKPKTDSAGPAKPSAGKKSPQRPRG